VAASDEDDEDWMFRTFDKIKKSNGPDKKALDPFAENEGSFKITNQPQNFIDNAADKCMSLNDFMKEMDQVGY